MSASDTPSPSALVEDIWKRCDAYTQRDPAVWLHRLTQAELRAHVTDVESRSSRGNEAGLPLARLTFAIKDNIDLAGVPTTAACPGYAYTPAESAHVVKNLLAAGAIPVGKTNLDQFATGLVGTRSPYGAPRNVFNPDYISGGSSSGSAVAVAAGLVDFALGTDTAGSGRVPAAFNQIIGLKPTRGLLSTRGVVPACRSLDCVSIFTRDIATATRVLTAAEGFDPLDPFSRPRPICHLISDKYSGPIRLGVPRANQLDWFGNTESPAFFSAALDRLRSLGAEIVEVDFAPFLDTALLLYEGPWTAERYAAVGEFIERHLTPAPAPASAPASSSSATITSASAPTSSLDALPSRNLAGLDPTVSKIILGGKTPSAADCFRATYRLAELRRAADTILASVDALVAPTTGTTYRVSEIEADPIRLNSNLGRYNNFMNLLDLCGLTLPAGRYTFGPGFGITLIAPAWHDRSLLTLGARYLGEPAPAEPVCNVLSDKPAGSKSLVSPSPSALSAPPEPRSPSALLPVSASSAQEVTLAVCGAHLRGQPLHNQLTTLRARFVAATTTAPTYRLYALANTTPPKPGLARTASNTPGAPISVETYALSPEAFGRFVAAVPAPMVIGTVELSDGRSVKGFLCEPCALTGANDITSFGGWVAFLASR